MLPGNGANLIEAFCKVVIASDQNTQLTKYSNIEQEGVVSHREQVILLNNDTSYG